MKAKVIYTDKLFTPLLNVGDVVEIIPGMETDAEGIWNAPAGKLVLCKKEDGRCCYASMRDMEIIEYSTVDWEKFRREAAKDILSALCSFQPINNYKEDVRQAINIADELIKQLKEK